MGQMLRLVLLSESHRIDRFPSGQAFAASARLVTCSQASGGTRLGTAGKKSGHAHRKWTLSAAATLCLRHHPQGQNLLARVEQNHDTGQALRMLAHQLGRAVSCMRTRQGAVAMAMVLPTSGRRAEEPGASRDAEGRRRSRASATPAPAASVHAQARRGRVSLRPRACLAPRSGS
jgi:Transposase IS116/IS110/IS902 family